MCIWRPGPSGVQEQLASYSADAHQADAMGYAPRFWEYEEDQTRELARRPRPSTLSRAIAEYSGRSMVQLASPARPETGDRRALRERLGQLLIPQSQATPPKLAGSGLHSLRAASAWLSSLALIAGLTLSAFLLRMSLLAGTSKGGAGRRRGIH